MLIFYCGALIRSSPLTGLVYHTSRCLTRSTQSQVSVNAGSMACRFFRCRFNWEREKLRHPCAFPPFSLSPKSRRFLILFCPCFSPPACNAQMEMTKQARQSKGKRVTSPRLFLKGRHFPAVGIDITRSGKGAFEKRKKGLKGPS